MHGEQRVVCLARQLAVRRSDLLLEGRLVRLPLLHELGERGLGRVRRFPQVRHLVRARIRVRVRVRVRVGARVRACAQERARGLCITVAVCTDTYSA